MKHKKKNLIYLTGFMGSGKTTIAPILANTLGYSHFDIDLEIEKATGKKVSEIFLKSGEGYFRDVERRLLQSVSQQEGCVVSLGGGTIANESNLKLVKSSGVLIYLKTESEQIFQRMRFKTDRPLLRTADGTPLSDEELHQRINLLLNAREPYYNQADVTISTDHTRVGKTIDEIIRRIKQLVE